MSGALEDRYRKVLRMLPRDYGADHDEEILAVLMDGSEEGQVRPKVGEVLSVGVLAVRLRFGGDGRRERDAGNVGADILRRAILAYLVLDLGLRLQADAYGVRIGFFFLPLLMELGIIVAMLFGRVWIGRALCVAFAVYTLHNDFWWLYHSEPLDIISFLRSVVPVMVPAAGLVVFHRKAPRVATASRWLAVLAVIAVAFFIRGRTIVYNTDFNIAHTPALPALIYAIAALAALRAAKSSPVWPSALALAGIPVISIALHGPLSGAVHVLADSPRDTGYLLLAIASESLLVATALVTLLLELLRRRVAAVTIPS